MKYKVILGSLIAGVLVFLLYSNLSKTNSPKLEDNASAQMDLSPRIVSTRPDPLEEAIISANEIIEVTFNRSLENVGEFKVRLETKKDFKVELSPDRKTAKIIPFKPYELGTTYTLFIGPDTKFDGIGSWGQEKIYHFRTIQYRGI